MKKVLLIMIVIAGGMTSCSKENVPRNLLEEFKRHGTIEYTNIIPLDNFTYKMSWSKEYININQITYSQEVNYSSCWQKIGRAMVDIVENKDGSVSFYYNGKLNYIIYINNGEEPSAELGVQIYYTDPYTGEETSSGFYARFVKKHIEDIYWCSR